MVGVGPVWKMELWGKGLRVAEEIGPTGEPYFCQVTGIFYVPAPAFKAHPSSSTPYVSMVGAH